MHGCKGDEGDRSGDEGPAFSLHSQEGDTEAALVVCSADHMAGCLLAAVVALCFEHAAQEPTRDNTHIWSLQRDVNRLSCQYRCRVKAMCCITMMLLLIARLSPLSGPKTKDPKHSLHWPFSAILSPQVHAMFAAVLVNLAVQSLHFKACISNLALQTLHFKPCISYFVYLAVLCCR